MNHFADLEVLRARLIEKAGTSEQDTIEVCLARLVDALEASWQRAEKEIDFGTYSDKYADMQNLAVVQKHLDVAAQALEAACSYRLTYYRW